MPRTTAKDALDAVKTKAQKDQEAPAASETPVYRLYLGTDHHYTASAEENDWLVSLGWQAEGIGWYGVMVLK